MGGVVFAKVVITANLGFYEGYGATNIDISQKRFI